LPVMANGLVGSLDDTLDESDDFAGGLGHLDDDDLLTLLDELENS